MSHCCLYLPFFVIREDKHLLKCFLASEFVLEQLGVFFFFFLILNLPSIWFPPGSTHYARGNSRKLLLPHHTGAPHSRPVEKAVLQFGHGQL